MIFYLLIKKSLTIIYCRTIRDNFIIKFNNILLKLHFYNLSIYINICIIHITLKLIYKLL